MSRVFSPFNRTPATFRSRSGNRRRNNRRSLVWHAGCYKEGAPRFPGQGDYVEHIVWYTIGWNTYWAVTPIPETATDEWINMGCKVRCNYDPIYLGC